ncbi:LYR motif-containing protein 2 [Vanacampus margaritifer]
MKSGCFDYGVVRTFGHNLSLKSAMATSRIPASTLSLKQFLRRQNILGIYRNMLRATRNVPDETDRKYLKDWAREEFKRNKNATNQDAIRMMITQANNHLEELQRSLALAGNSTQKTTKDTFSVLPDNSKQIETSI